MTSGAALAPILPADWKWVKLGDVVEFLDHLRVPVKELERSARTAGLSPSALFPYYGANGQAGWIDSYLFDEELVLLAEDGGSFGSSMVPIAYRVNGKCWVNNHAHVLRPGPSLDPDWLWVTLAIRPDVEEYTSGSTRPKLNQQLARAIPIPCPPVEEQRRIVAALHGRLNAVAQARAAAAAQLEAARALPVSLLRAVFESAEAQRWPHATLGEVSTFLPARSVKNNGVRRVTTVTTACLTELGFDPAGVKQASMDERAADDATLAPGEILVARSNTSELVGRVARYAGDPRDVVASDLTIRVWPANGFDGDFLTYYLSSLYLSGFWRERAGGTSSSMKKITRKQLVALDVPKPPIDIQQNLAANLKHGLDHAWDIQREAQQVLATFDGLPSALLRSAFSGEL